LILNKTPSRCYIPFLSLQQDWESAAGMARALSIGQKESAALFALTNDIPFEIVAELEHAVKVRGMSRFLNHDVIGKGTFSTGC
jgi:hypothetical protein